MEQERADATAEKKALEGENQVIKKDMEDLELAIQKLEQEKTNRDHNIRSLNDEISNQDEVINKLNKEKKHVGENSSKALEDLQCAEDKASHLNNIKSKLETNESIQNLQLKIVQKAYLQKLLTKEQEDYRMALVLTH